MYFNPAILVSFLAIGTAAAHVKARDYHDSNGGLKVICPHLATQDKGCIRYTRGFDITGTRNDVDFTFPTVKTECDCIELCLKRPMTCANYVYKFTTPASVKSGHRVCTLYSDFDLPLGVQGGGLVPEAFLDINLNKTADPMAVSGPVWQLQDGQVQC